MTGIVNYGAGNIRSVQFAVSVCGEEVFVIERPVDLQKADKIILPGVGAFADGIGSLYTKGMVEPLVAEIKNGRPFLGICLGLQLVFSHSEEGNCQGFGLVDGEVEQFYFKDKTLRVPHMAWNTVKIVDNTEMLFNNIPDKQYFYFAHSYYPVPADHSVIIGTSFYGIEFVSAIRKNNLVGVQFHPEKSGCYGIRFIKNFLEGKWLQ